MGVPSVSILFFIKGCPMIFLPLPYVIPYRMAWICLCSCFSLDTWPWHNLTTTVVGSSSSSYSSSSSSYIAFNVWFAGRLNWGHSGWAPVNSATKHGQDLCFCWFLFYAWYTIALSFTGLRVRNHSVRSARCFASKVRETWFSSGPLPGYKAGWFVVLSTLMKRKKATFKNCGWVNLCENCKRQENYGNSCWGKGWNYSRAS
jgi:hypothetical protein